MQARKTGNAQGIDVSHHNGNIDFKKVAADGISFVFIKATQGKSFRSTKFLQFVKDAKAAGLLIGAYHYVDDSAGSVESAKAEAQNFYKAIQAAGGIGTFDLPPVMDYESNKNGHSKATITAVATTFLAEIQKLTGVKPLVYTYPAFIGNFSGLSGYPLWIARYSTQTPADASGWTRWDFWQYSDGAAGGYPPRGTRKVDGISGAVDLNEFDGTVAELKAKYTKTKEDKPLTLEVMKQMEKLKATVESQAKWIAAQKAKENMECPKWAEEAYEYYQAFISDKTGSYDFWRQLVLSYRKDKGIRVS
ncbi:glycoside hydrolase family 25 protein [Paenibacillus tundrae]|uniref:glycoside hydrolase family 25 protein n=1 Tax=Paenibacillus tundrae TaxID=528187 RepID=UPI0022A9D30B|nr:glycoside hydrolase family 25 protein [Paenibacillus tundrae]